jgi:hypothetical protein
MRKCKRAFLICIACLGLYVFLIRPILLTKTYLTGSYAEVDHMVIQYYQHGWGHVILEKGDSTEYIYSVLKSGKKRLIRTHDGIVFDPRFDLVIIYTDGHQDTLVANYSLYKQVPKSTWLIRCETKDLVAEMLESKDSFS